MRLIGLVNTGSIRKASRDQPLSAEQWVVAYTKPRHEKSVARHFGQRAIGYYLPVYSSQRTWRDGTKPQIELPLFPNYIFVKISRPELGRVLEVPGVLRLVPGTGGAPACFPDHLVEALRSELPQRNAEPHPLVTTGGRVRIRRGALAGLEGVVVRTGNGIRVVLTVEYILRSVSIEVSIEDLEMLDAQSGAVEMEL
jgi:transcription antitermination factor NusG